MNDITIFRNPQFGEIRTVIKESEPWFVLADLCRALNVTNASDVSRRLPDDMKGIDSVDTLGGKQNVTIVSEAGMYEVVIRSDKPEAAAFRRWITSDVLPSIRKHGAYLTPEAVERTLMDPDYLIQLATALKDERARRMNAEKVVSIMAPKAEFYDAVASSGTAMSIREFAAVLGVKGLGQNNLFRFLREHNILMTGNIPYREYIERGLFKVIEQTFTRNGATETDTKTLVTGKGQDFIRKLVAEHLGGAA